MNEHTKELISHTYTKDNLHRKVLLLEEFFSQYFFREHAEGSVRDHLKNFLLEQSIGDHLRSNLLSLSDEFFSQFTQDNYKGIFDGLRHEAENLPQLKLYVPTILPPSEVEKLGVWCREHIAQQIFLDIEVESNTVGGCAFVWNGVYHDYSLSYYMNEKRKEIRNLIAEK